MNVNDIMAVESHFYKSLGNGKVALGLAETMVKSVVTSRDTTVLSKAMKRAKEKGDDKACQSLRLITKAVFPECKVTTDKNGTFVVKIQGVQANDFALKTLEALVKDGASLRGNLVAKAFGEKVEKPFDVIAWAKHNAARHPDMVDAMIAALQATRK